MQSPVYWHPWLYRLAIKLSFGKKFETRYSALNKFIPENCELTELCMGDAYFYLNYLKQKKVRYSCIDINPVFINVARKKGLKAFLGNIMSDPLTKADHILIQGSLYHFIPNEAVMIKKMLDACNKKVIISENVENLSNSNSGISSYIGEKLSKAKAGQSKIKFTRESLKKAFEPFKDHIEVWEESPDNLEIIVVLKKNP